MVAQASSGLSPEKSQIAAGAHAGVGQEDSLDGFPGTTTAMAQFSLFRTR
jgi:hypothetical protein